MAKNAEVSKQEENEKEEMGEKQVKKMVFDDSSSLDGRTDGRTDGQMDGRTDRWTHPLIEMREHIYEVCVYICGKTELKTKG